MEQFSPRILIVDDDQNFVAALAEFARLSGCEVQTAYTVAGARRATEHLLGLGHRTVHYLGIPSPSWPSGRMKGWRDALEAAGAPVPDVVECGWDPQEAFQRGRELAGDATMTAVLCGNDQLAIGVMRAMAEAGRRVPGDVSVVGFDGEPVAALLTPALTTVEQDFVRLGHRAVQMLVDRIDHGTSVQTSSAVPRLVVRESTAPPAGVPVG